MTTVLLVLTFREEDLPRRDEVRPAHRDWVSNLSDAGVITAAGPFTDVDTIGAMLFAVDGIDDVHALLRDEPYHLAGLVHRTEVHEWNVVFGSVTPTAG